MEKTPVALLHTTTKLFTVDGYFVSWRFHKTIVKVIATVSTSTSLFDRTCRLAQQGTAYSILDYTIVQYIKSFQFFISKLIVLSVFKKYPYPVKVFSFIGDFSLLVWELKKPSCVIAHLQSYSNPNFSSFFDYHKFSILASFLHSHKICVCLPRASIFQKKIIYFQDQGSLTIRLCEKGNVVPLSDPVSPIWKYNKVKLFKFWNLYLCQYFNSNKSFSELIYCVAFDCRRFYFIFTFCFDLPTQIFVFAVYHLL